MDDKLPVGTGYPITKLRELPFDKSGSHFVKELENCHDCETVMATVCYALGIINTPGKNNLTDVCKSICYGLLYEQNDSEDDGLKWIKIYPEIENLYRSIVHVQDELCPNGRQRATRGELERRTFERLADELSPKLLQSEPLDYVDYVYLNTPQINFHLLQQFKERLTNNFEKITNEIEKMSTAQAIGLLCKILPLTNGILHTMQEYKEEQISSFEKAESDPNETDLKNLRSALLSKRKKLYDDGKAYNENRRTFDYRIQISDTRSPENNEMLKRYFDKPEVVANQHKYNDEALPYYKIWLLHQLDDQWIKNGDNVRQTYRFYWNFFEKKSTEYVKDHIAQKLQARIDELFTDLSYGQFIRYYYALPCYDSAADIFLDSLLRNAYDHLFVAVHDAFSAMVCVKKTWGTFSTSIAQLHKLQSDTGLDAPTREYLQSIIKAPAYAMSNMLESANHQLMNNFSDAPLDLYDISKDTRRRQCLQCHPIIIQELEKMSLEIFPQELSFLSERYRMLLYNCYTILQYKKEESVSEILDSFLKSYTE